jgi:hypothetical protein
VMRVRVETALAKAIAASDRLALVPVELAAATTGGEEEQQQGNLRKNIQENNTTRNAVNHLILGPVNPAMGDFMRNFQRVQREHKEQREREQQRQQQQEQQQQQPPAGLVDYHAWAAVNLPQSVATPAAAAAAAAATAAAATTNNNGQQQQQQQQQQGKATFSIISYLTDTQTTYPPGLVKERIASIEEQAASPPHGVDLRTLASGLPPDQIDSDSDSNVVFELATNTSTGSATVDHLEVRLEEEDMDDNEAPDESLIQGKARMEDS